MLASEISKNPPVDHAVANVASVAIVIETAAAFAPLKL
jgi:hypothetical protein